MVCVARFPNVGRMGSGGKGGGIFGPGSPSTVGADRIRPPDGFEPGFPSAPLGVRDPRMGQDLGRDQDGEDRRMGQDHGKAREASLSPPFAPFSLPPVKFIWQCYSELCRLAKNTLPAPLEVKVFCPYLCTTPQGRDGRRATDNREGKRGAGRCTARSADHRKTPPKNILKKILRFRKRFLPLQSQPRETATDAMSGAEKNDRLRPSFTEGTQHKKAEARCPGAISSLNDHVAQRPVREYGS